MKFTNTYRGVESDKELELRIEEVMSKLEKYFTKHAYCYSVISKQGKTDANCKVEITIASGNQSFRAEEVSESYLKAVDMVYDKLKKQIRRYKDKMIAKKRSAQAETAKRFEPFDDELVLVEESDVPDDIIEKFSIARVKQFKLEPMCVEDAVMKMDTLDHPFFVFLNKDTGKVNVVYQRIDGAYGLIETC